MGESLSQARQRGGLPSTLWYWLHILMVMMREALQRLYDEGCHLFLWSSVGVDYACKVAAFHGLTELFEGYASKPDIIIDDVPSTAQAQFVYTVREERSWQSLAERIIARHIN
jgi:hypothetical protein